MSFSGKAIVCFYRDGFGSMELGRTLWKLVVIKLFILFALIRFFLMPDILQTRFATDRDRADHVLQTLTRVPNLSSLPVPRHGRQP